ncbi:MAG: rRNA maturation RNase YbeY [Clostridiales bacterium]|nr:rRNA maturation RNase YbeY [Clostridiales bacterium]
MRIVFDEEWEPDAGLHKLFERAAELVFAHEGVDGTGCEVSVFFADADEIAALNLQYRGKDGATDVLSFPMYEAADEIRAAALDASDEPEAGPVLIGDVVICMDVAERQAAELGHSTERELAYLFAHSALHLLGHDHEDDDERRAAMRAAEKAVMAEIGEVAI